MARVHLRDVVEDDLPIFFEHQLDADATEMAGFPSREREAFTAHWAKVLSNSSNITQTIVADGRVAGNIGSWEQSGERDIGYWLGKEYWGQGIATEAVSAFVDLVGTRPLYAHVVKHNAASLRVLQKCGFVLHGEEADEWALTLDTPAAHDVP